jgi:hypothetical protein
MKLLFKDDTFADEFKEFLGFVDADFTFLNLKSDIRSSSREMRSFIGQDLYEIAEVLFEDDIDEDDEKFEFLQLVKCSILVNAYRLYAPDNDLSHTNDGRKMRNEEHEKHAFEWMINASDDSLEKRYYRMLEHLINYLDEIEEDTDLADIYEAWTESKTFKRLKKHFVQTVSDFDEFFPINSKLLLIKLEPGISLAEKNLIQSRIKADKYEQLLTAPTDTDETIISTIKEICVYFALSWAIPRMSVNILPTGILQRYSSDRSTLKASAAPALNEPKWAQDSFLTDAHKAAIRLENLLKPAPDPSDTDIKPKIIYNDNSFNCI